MKAFVIRNEANRATSMAFSFLILLVFITVVVYSHVDAIQCDLKVSVAMRERDVIGS
jgi:hypothetical protein